MMLKIELGCCPLNDDAVQLSNVEDNSQLMRRQCRAWRDLIFRTLQKNREHRDASVKLSVTSMDHDFGTYYEVVGSCDEADEAAVEALFWLESNLPEEPDDEYRITIHD